ncbi:MAG: thermonuclease family protein [Rhizobiaceae bacterium]
MNRAALIAVALIPVPVPAFADPACGLYQYRARITDVCDGDSVTADVDLGFHTWIHDEKFRLLGIDTPEVTGASKAAGIAARDALKERIEGKELIICTVKGANGADKREKFGRYLVKIYVGDELINDWMIAQGHAVPYDGGPRD